MSSPTPHDPPALQPVHTARVERVQVADGVTLAVRRFDPPGNDGASLTLGTTAIPFVLVHGLASNARTWDGVAAALAEAGHEVAALDLRGHGHSDKPAAGYDVATVADDVRAAIDALGFDRPVVAGQSWGGNVVVELGWRHPTAVRGIVGVDGGLIELARRFPDWADCERELAPPRLAGTPFDRMNAWIRGAHPDWPEIGIAGTLANFEHRPDGTIAPWLTFERHLTVLHGLWEHHPLELLATGYPVPLAFVMADGDDAGAAEKRATVAEARGLTPGIRVEWVANGDHDLHAQAPQRLAASLLDLLGDGWLG